MNQTAITLARAIAVCDAEGDLKPLIVDLKHQGVGTRPRKCLLCNHCLACEDGALQSEIEHLADGLVCADLSFLPRTKRIFSKPLGAKSVQAFLIVHNGKSAQDPQHVLHVVLGATEASNDCTYLAVELSAQLMRNLTARVPSTGLWRFSGAG